MRAAQSRSTADDSLVTDHLPLVGYLVSEVMGRLPAHMDRDDLLSAGTVALVQAARGFDEARGVPFARYASLRIRGALIDELRSYDWASRSVRPKARARDEATEELAVALGRRPRPAEVAAHLGVPLAEVLSGEGDVHRAVVLRLDAFTDIDGQAPVPSREALPLDTLLARERMGYLHDAIAVLPERLKRVVVGYFFEELPMVDLAAELGVTESRISQLRAEALSLVGEALRTALDDSPRPVESSDGCAARRRAAYVEAATTRSDTNDRLSTRPLAVTDAVLAHAVVGAGVRELVPVKVSLGIPQAW
jgi:RNA polymerase sigma factor FliA